MTDDFPRRLRALREEMRPVRSQRATSELMGLPPDALRRYECGEVKPKLDALGLIADYYHVSTDYLLGRTYRREMMRTHLPWANSSLIPALNVLLRTWSIRRIVIASMPS